MAIVYYTPNYYFKGGLWIKPLKRFAEKSFMRIRSKWVKRVNPYYDDINTMWDMAYPGIKLEGENLNKYDRYVAAATNHLLLRDYKRYPGNLLFKGMSNPETADFRLVFRFNKNMVVDYDMTPVK